MMRKSRDLVHWYFLGWVFNGVPAVPLQFMTANQPGYQQLSLWAPCIIKVGDKLRLYYSVPGNDGLKLACIGLATSTLPEGPWTDEGIVISCLPTDPYNAIDPSVIVNHHNEKQWMTYGSYEEGIYIVELDPSTGKRLTGGDLGHKIAYRLKRHDAIEGSEILYVPEQNMYYLFVSYDWLEDAYNVRVGRSENPEGPYYDINDNNLADIGDNYPMITAQYRFNDHSGWQGVGHNSVIKDGDNYFFVSQGRLGANKYFMDLHVRRLVFTPDGWPVVSPERFAGVPQDAITQADLTGSWEHIELQFTSVKNSSLTIELKSDGTIAGMDASSWMFDNNILTLSMNNNQKVFTARVFKEWDWEKDKITFVYTGITPAGLAGGG
jgi:arabinan endo-1,5-alpha-L-arabinosidase